MSLALEGGRTGWEPGATLRGSVTWSLERPPRSLRLELVWWTEGKGTRDARVVEAIQLGPAREGQAPFELGLPRFPYSYEGRLVSLVWGLQLVAERAEQLELATFELGPGGRAIRGGAADPPGKGA